MCRNLILIQELHKIHNDYYETSRKNIFFKKSQMVESVENIISKIPLDELIQCSIYEIPNTNKLYFDYIVFKMYASQSNYKTIIQYMIIKIQAIIQVYGNFEMHMNMKSFTVSATERYMDAIRFFCNECYIKNEMFSNSLLQMYIYNTPCVINTISSMVLKLLSHEIRSKITTIPKDNSVEQLNKLFTN